MTEQTGSTQATGGSSGPLSGLKAEFERVKHTADDVKTDLAAVTDKRRGGPATSVEDATAKAAALRRGIERDVATLRARVPEGDVVTQKARAVIPAVGGGLLVLATIIVLLKRRGSNKRCKAHESAVREQAAALARELARLETVEIDLEDGGGRLKWLVMGLLLGTGAGAMAWQRSRGSADVEDVFGAPQDDPLRPSDVGS